MKTQNQKSCSAIAILFVMLFRSDDLCIKMTGGNSGGTKEKKEKRKRRKKRKRKKEKVTKMAGEGSGSGGNRRFLTAVRR